MTFAILTTYQGIFLGPVAKLLGYILQWIYAAFSNFGIENVGICIIIFTFFINALMIPIQVKQQKFARMSSIMNPEIQAIQEKYKGKKDQASQQKMSLETQAVYQKYGVSPASGCLPMLISIPIFFALYRVIYNIPAYVPQVKDLYEQLADKLVNANVSVSDIATYVTSKTYVVTDAVKHASSAKGTTNIVNYYIDVLSQLSPDGWKNLAAKYSDYNTIITSTSAKVAHINSFLGLNIADRPSLKSVSIIIPILSIVSQIFSTKLSMATANTQQGNSQNAATAQTMKMMNNVMPLVSGAMCLMFPIGVGIYWIAGNVFRIIQSLGINFYFSRHDLEAEIKQNVEKSKKRFKLMGMDQKEIDEITKHKNVPKKDAASETTEATKDNNKKSLSSIANIKVQNDSKDSDSNFEKGSIASYAHMLGKDSKDNK